MYYIILYYILLRVWLYFARRYFHVTMLFLRSCLFFYKTPFPCSLPSKQTSPSSSPLWAFQTEKRKQIKLRKMESGDSNTHTGSSSSPPSQSPTSSSSPPPQVVLSPCAACKILRRRCAEKCVLAPYFPPTEPAKFTIAHRVFGASNIIKFLQVLVTLCAHITHIFGGKKKWIYISYAFLLYVNDMLVTLLCILLDILGLILSLDF